MRTRVDFYMGRQFVICLDGTNNRFSDSPTNVVRLFKSLSTESNGVLSYYDQGVGTFGIKETLFEWQKLPSRVFGLAFGWGLKRIVESAYNFLAENLKEDDEIFIFGFSRGAYSARVLASIICAVGLLPAHLTHLFDYGWTMLLAIDGKTGKPNFGLQARFKSTFGKSVKIRFLGLFDTVKSVGWIYDPVVMPYTAHNPIVEVVRHALSIDERRCFFRQNCWKKKPTDKTNVKEVWFAGVHSDIGGGYPAEESQLALVVYRWMLGEALRAGLKLDSKRCKKQLLVAKTDYSAGMHNSMSIPWKFTEWLPRFVWSYSKGRRVLKIGAMPPLGEPKYRFISSKALIHKSVEQRSNGRNDYRPSNLPRKYSIIDDDPSLDGFI